MTIGSGQTLPGFRSKNSRGRHTHDVRGWKSDVQMKTILEAVRLVVASPAHYTTRIAKTSDEIRAAEALRFDVFNLELNEGLQESYVTGLDEDPFDAFCDHLIVQHLPSSQIVGTYRMQTGLSAAIHL